MPDIDNDILTIELNNLKTKCEENNWFAAIFAVKDSYELLVKYSCLTVASLIFNQDGTDDVFKVLTDPNRSMSFGDWTNDVVKIIRDSHYVKNDAMFSDFFKALVKLVEASKIVSWRNDTIGHGAMKFHADAQMISDIKEKENAILNFVAAQNTAIQSLAAYNAECHKPERAPFIIWEDGKALLFESMGQDGNSRYLDISGRSRIRRAEPLWTEKKQKYHGSLNVSNNMTSSVDGYDSELDSILAAFHKANNYEKPAYLASTVKRWLKTYDAGTFLIYADRGTGKSAFVYACDELQHDKGEQKVKLSYDNVKVSVRAYYANRTEMLTPDEAERHIFEVLETSQNNNTIRLRGISQQKLWEMPFTDRVNQYFERYKADGIDKLVIFIDGLDELNDNNADILKCIPDGTTVPSGIYFICLCRSKSEGIPSKVSSYCNNIHFTEIKSFNRTAENAMLLAAFLKSRINLSDGEADILAKKLDFRFSAVPLLEVLDSDDIKSFLADDGDKAHKGGGIVAETGNLSAKVIISKYLEKLRLRYGDVYFRRMLRIAIIVAETPGEAMEMQEVCWLAEGRSLSTREVAYFYDLRPLLMEFRDYRGAVYGMASVTWTDILRELYPNILKEIALEWERDLLTIDTHIDSLYAPQEWNANLYKASVLVLYLKRYNLRLSDYNLLKQITYIATRFKEGGQQHITYRSMRCFNTLFNIYFEQLEEAFEEEAMLCFLAVFNTCVTQYVNLGIENQLHGMVADVETMLGKYETKCEKHYDISFQTMTFFNNMICVCGDLYDLKRGESYFDRAEKRYKQMLIDWPEQREDYELLWHSIWHNAVSLTRYVDPEKAVRMAAPMLDEMRKWARGYDDISTGCAVAMSYLSAGEGMTGYKILKECDMRLDQLPPPCNFEESKIYIVTKWRYSQMLHEMYGSNGAAVEDIEKAVRVMDQILNYLVSTEQNGFSNLSHWKPQMVMTAALLRGKLAEIKYNAVGFSDEVQSHLSQAVEIAEKVTQIYDEWDRLGIAYDRTSAMHNYVNIGAIYAEALQPEKAIESIQAAMHKYNPRNETEQQVYRLMIAKIKEIKTYYLKNNM